MRAHLTNLGCKLNQAEMEDLARRLAADGHQIVRSLEQADLHIVNTCTVTHVAARTSRKSARRAGRSGSRTRTVLTGCYVNGSPAEAAQLAGVDLVVPNEDKEHLVERLYEHFPAWRPLAPRGESVPVPYVPLEFGNSRALVKIEDGCNMSCSFCIIPSTRGRQRSRPADEIIEEIDRLERSGFREIVITGVQISSYRSADERLASLTRRILEETDVERLRLTSIAPWDFDPALLDLLDTGRVCRHFHLSLQSGCNRTLEAMRRPYDQNQFSHLVERIRERAPGTAITTDVIVGFPGETEVDFDDSLAFIAAMRFAKIHAFPYSSRPGTSAAEMSDQVPPRVQRERMKRLQAIADEAERSFREAHLGEVLPVLWEGERDGIWHGTSDNYLKVSAEPTSELGADQGPDLHRALTPTLIARIDGPSTHGQPLLALSS